MNSKLITAAEWIMAALLTAAVLVLMIVRVTHAGALWRDEAAAVQLAQFPAVGEIAANFQHEAFPLPFPLMLRSYIAVFGASDASVRMFGFLAGLLLLAVAWFNSRIVGGSSPVVFLALFGLNELFLVWGTSVRGYGLGSALVLLTVDLTVRAVRTPNLRNAVAATIAAVASAQVLVNSLPLVVAIAASAFLVFLLERKVNEARLVCLCALIPALCFLPYLHSYLGADWTIVLKFPTSISLLSTRFQEALASQHQITALLWESTVVLFLVIAIWACRRRAENSAELRSLRFIAAFVVLSIVSYAIFLRTLSYATRSWYYLPLICAIAGAVDLVAVPINRMASLRLIRIVVGLVFVILTPLTLPQLLKPFSNIDRIARKLETEAAGNDLIVLNPWHLGPSFYRYYHGATPWMTSPAMDEHRIHRYDVMKAKMLEEDPLGEVRDAIRRTLKSYHRVWIVGGARPPEEGLPANPGRPPHPQLGWAGYMGFWSMELGTFLNEHVVVGDVVVEPPKDTLPVENVPLLSASGWQD